MIPTIHFLGTGASGGTPGEGRSSRMESSALVDAGSCALLDVTRDFSEQCREIESLDAVLLTHAHRDACGGIAGLRGWWRDRGSAPVRVYASSQTIAALRSRFRRLDHCEFVATEEGRRRRLGSLACTALTVPHARERRYPTYAWKVSAGGRTLVYASDVARLTPRLRRFCRGVNLLVIDGAMWRRRPFSHLTIDAELPSMCGWRVDRVLLTQIGKSVPPHERLEREVAKLCPKAAPAYDGLKLPL
jgi:phosphoribosyl 1,2-cyclic phosphodiesterase